MTKKRYTKLLRALFTDLYIFSQSTDKPINHRTFNRIIKSINPCPSLTVNYTRQQIYDMISRGIK
jgi:hypothetical protein